MEPVLLIDFGSTYTKALLVDLDEEVLLGRAQSLSTVNENMLDGLKTALQKLLRIVSTAQPGFDERHITRKLACSSAAGGLRLVAVGLVPDLTLEAARRAALGAGAKVVGSYSFEITPADIKEMERKGCDLILLSGGTDGGNKEAILQNAGLLAKSALEVPVVVAGNRAVADRVREVLEKAGKYVEVTENVLPELSTINVEPARNAIRDIFMKRIVHAKGLDKAQAYVGEILMPTPLATLKAATLVANGVSGEPGFGELLVVEVGGATTNVHSVASGSPTRSNVSVKGLPEPYAKRTVEGDLGIRYNAGTIVGLAGEAGVLENIPGGKEALGPVRLKDFAESLSGNLGFVPESDAEFLADIGLARTAVDMAVTRHCGQLREVITLNGPVFLQQGKDLSELKTVIGTGGIFAYGRNPEYILKAALFAQRNPLSLKPRAPDFFIDRHYILYGIGLLSDLAPRKALRIAKKYLSAPESRTRPLPGSALSRGPAEPV